MTKQMDESGFEKPESNAFKFTKPGDAIKGVFLESKDFSGSFGPTRSYSVRAIEGFFHNVSKDGVVDEKPTDVVPGEVYYFFGKNTFSEDLNKAVPGQQVIVKFVDERKSKSNGKNYKYIEAMLGKMDEAYFEESQPKDDIAF